MAEINPWGAFGIADMIAGGSVDETHMGRASRDAACAAGIEINEIPEGGPRSKMAKVANKAESLEHTKVRSDGKKGQCHAQLRSVSEIGSVIYQMLGEFSRDVGKTTCSAHRRSGAGAVGTFRRRQKSSDVFAALRKSMLFVGSRP